jgi:glucokinase
MPLASKKQKEKKDKVLGEAAIGIDVGGTKTLLALFDSRFEVLAEDKFRTHPEKGGLAAFEKALRGSLETLVRVARKLKLEVQHVGVGCAGDIDMKKGVVRRSPNLTFLDGYPFRERLEKMTKAKVFVGHDVQAALYGEYRLGAAKKARHAIGVWMGTGVGGAMIVDGRIHLGTTGSAGDIGNYLLSAVDVSTESPRKYRLDGVASRTSIAAEAAALAAKHKAPALRKHAGTDVGDIRAGDIARSIRKGDKAVEKLVRARANIVGVALSNLVDFINPDVVVLGGGLVEAMPALVRAEVRKSITAHASRKAARAVKVVVAKLHRHAGTVGAARLALDVTNGRGPLPP